MIMAWMAASHTHRPRPQPTPSIEPWPYAVCPRASAIVHDAARAHGASVGRRLLVARVATSHACDAHSTSQPRPGHGGHAHWPSDKTSTMDAAAIVWIAGGRDGAVLSGDFCVWAGVFAVGSGASTGSAARPKFFCVWGGDGVAGDGVGTGSAAAEVSSIQDGASSSLQARRQARGYTQPSTRHDHASAAASTSKRPRVAGYPTASGTGVTTVRIARSPQSTS